jgi:hypothetical protein
MEKRKRRPSQLPRWVTVQLENINRFAFWQARRILCNKAYIEASENPDRDPRSIVRRHVRNLAEYVEIAVPLASVRETVRISADYRAECLTRKMRELETEPARKESREVDSLVSERISALQFQIDTLTNIDLRRIKRCEDCGKLYGAARRPAPGCSKQCNVRLRGRRAWKKRQLREHQRSVRGQ